MKIKNELVNQNDHENLKLFTISSVVEGNESKEETPDKEANVSNIREEISDYNSIKIRRSEKPLIKRGRIR